MTKKELEQLKALKIEIKKINDEINNLPIITDSVKGSMAEFPYIERMVIIEGVDETAADKLRKKLTDKCDLLQAKILRMEDWLDNVEDSEIRTILRLRYRNGLSWQQIVYELGRDGDGSTERKKCEKILKSG